MIKGLVIIIGIAVAIGSVGLLSGQSFLAWFIAGVILQLLFNFALNTGMKTWGQVQINKLLVERMNTIDRNRVEVPCETCKEINEIDLSFNHDNEFRCEKCKTLNKVFVTWDVVQKTEIPENAVITEDIVKQIKKEVE